MKPILIVYATRQGHTRLVAEHVQRHLGTRGIEAVLRDVRETPRPLDLPAYSGAILAAPIHLGRHERALEKLIAREREGLAALPTAFLSVSLSAVTLGDETQPPERRDEVARELEKITDAMFARTGWHPDRTEPVAGALMYTKYNLLVRWIMRRIARAEGASDDVSRDHVYTRWDALDRFVDAFVALASGPRPAAEAGIDSHPAGVRSGG